jgi:E3 ubiquitin-protein ligase DOA10
MSKLQNKVKYSLLRKIGLLHHQLVILFVWNVLQMGVKLPCYSNLTLHNFVNVNTQVKYK